MAIGLGLNCWSSPLSLFLCLTYDEHIHSPWLIHMRSFSVLRSVKRESAFPVFGNKDFPSARRAERMTMHYMEIRKQLR